MGHDEHFLSRLDRVDREEVDLALSLYRDHELVHHILAVAKLPGDAERIAISLGDRRAGPFIIVHRNGHFVTCLARGMTHDCPVLTRDRLDAIVLGLAGFRARRDHAGALTGLDGTRVLMESIVRKSDALSREDVTALMAMAPLYARAMLTELIESAIVLGETREKLLGLRRCRTLPEREFAANYWRLLWAQANSIVLLAGAGRAFLDDLGERLDGIPFTLTSHLARQGVFAISARAVWFAARAGRSMLPQYKRALEGRGDGPTLVDAECGLWAMGIRHAGLRAEVVKTLRPDAQDLAAGDAHAHHRSAFLALLEKAEAEGGMETALLEDGAQEVVRAVRRFPEDSPYRALGRMEDVPVDLARTMTLRWLIDTLEPFGAGHAILCGGLSTLARARAEDFFFPEDFAREHGSRFSPELVVDFAERARRARAAARPPAAITTKLQGRNEPCACGSGKKYKRCCGV